MSNVLDTFSITIGNIQVATDSISGISQIEPQSIQVITTALRNTMADPSSGTDDQVAWIALIVSVLGLLISTIWNFITVRIAHSHNKKSVEPLLTFLHGMYPEDGIERFSVKNSGLGPALIDSLEFIYNETSYQEITSLYEDHLPQWAGSLDWDLSKRMLVYHSTVMSPGEELQIFKNQYSTESLTPHCTDFLEGVYLKVVYRTMYGDNKILLEKVIETEAVESD